MDSNQQEHQQARRTAVLFVACLLYTKSNPGANTQAWKTNATLAFDFAEIFVEEAERRGYDPASIMDLGGGPII